MTKAYSEISCGGRGADQAGKASDSELMLTNTEFSKLLFDEIRDIEEGINLSLIGFGISIGSETSQTDEESQIEMDLMIAGIEQSVKNLTGETI